MTSALLEKVIQFFLLVLFLFQSILFFTYLLRLDFIMQLSVQVLPQHIYRLLYLEPTRHCGASLEVTFGYWVLLFPDILIKSCRAVPSHWQCHHMSKKLALCKQAKLHWQPFKFTLFITSLRKRLILSDQGRPHPLRRGSCAPCCCSCFFCKSCVVPGGLASSYTKLSYHYMVATCLIIDSPVPSAFSSHSKNDPSSTYSKPIAA